MSQKNPEKKKTFNHSQWQTARNVYSHGAEFCFLSAMTANEVSGSNAHISKGNNMAALKLC